MSNVSSYGELIRQGEDHRDWYVHARRRVSHLAQVHNVDTERMACLLALFSPRTAVVRSETMAVHYLTTGGFTPDVIRGVRASVWHWEKTREIRGPKVRAFARALCGDDTSIVLDTHMARAFGVPEKKVYRKDYFQKIRRVLRWWASRLRWTPCEVQAALWAGYYRGAYPTGQVPTFPQETVYGSDPIVG